MWNKKEAGIKATHLRSEAATLPIEQQLPHSGIHTDIFHVLASLEFDWLTANENSAVSGFFGMNYCIDAT